MNYVVGDRNLNWLQAHLPQADMEYAVMDGETLGVSVMAGRELVWGMLHGFPVDTYSDGQLRCLYLLDGNAFFRRNNRFNKIGIHMQVGYFCIRLIRNDDGRELVWQVLDNVLYVNDTPVVGFAVRNLRLGRLFNLGKDIFRMDIVTDSLGVAYGLSFFMDVAAMQFLYMEYVCDGVRNEVQILGLEYSHRRDWFLGRLAKHRMLFGISPLLLV